MPSRSPTHKIESQSLEAIKEPKENDNGGLLSLTQTPDYLVPNVSRNLAWNILALSNSHQCQNEQCNLAALKVAWRDSYNYMALCSRDDAHVPSVQRQGNEVC